MDNKTIFALSTVYGKSGVAVVRVSGKSALLAVKELTDINIDSIKPRFAYFSKIYACGKNEVIDNALLIYFKSPYSFNGEDIVEFQIHGSKAVILSLIENLGKLPDFRLAEAGEFSKRAFYNGKMDLTQAEGLADLIDAETKEQQRFAVKQMSGNLKDLYNSWRESLIKVLAHIEAYIDFPDEDIPEDVYHNLLNSVFKISGEIKNHLNSNKNTERLRDGFNVVIIGRPNAGKSSLLNTIIKRDAVIVSDIAGTTRDAIDLHFDLNGYPVVITDTAGLRDKTNDIIEEKGIEIAKNRIKNADIILALFDAQTENKNIFANIVKNHENNVIYVANKCDKLSEEQCSELKNNCDILISAKNNSGIDNLLDKISEIIKNSFAVSSGAAITRERYRALLTETVEYLDNFSLDKEIELSAEDIRLAVRAIGKIVGKVDVDEILDRIFGDFCIGK